MEQFDVSRITVANALTQLAKDGWIYRIPGRGSFVGENINELLGGSHVREPGSGFGFGGAERPGQCGEHRRSGQCGQCGRGEQCV
ncbi:hypothetical protein HMSSN036_71980 [Paenibacillus macerans]|nr:hypothetical protein HMSSN036_71980 [Paenibacillus macerans]